MIIYELSKATIRYKFWFYYYLKLFDRRSLFLWNGMNIDHILSFVFETKQTWNCAAPEKCHIIKVFSLNFAIGKQDPTVQERLVHVNSADFKPEREKQTKLEVIVLQNSIPCPFSIYWTHLLG